MLEGVSATISSLFEFTRDNPAQIIQERRSRNIDHRIEDIRCVQGQKNPGSKANLFKAFAQCSLGVDYTRHEQQSKNKTRVDELCESLCSSDPKIREGIQKRPNRLKHYLDALDVAEYDKETWQHGINAGVKILVAEELWRKRLEMYDQPLLTDGIAAFTAIKTFAFGHLRYKEIPEFINLILPPNPNVEALSVRFTVDQLDIQCSVADALIALSPWFRKFRSMYNSRLSLSINYLSDIMLDNITSTQNKHDSMYQGSALFNEGSSLISPKQMLSSMRNSRLLANQPEKDTQQLEREDSQQQLNIDQRRESHGNMSGAESTLDSVSSVSGHRLASPTPGTAQFQSISQTVEDNEIPSIPTVPVQNPLNDSSLSTLQTVVPTSHSITDLSSSVTDNVREHIPSMQDTTRVSSIFQQALSVNTAESHRSGLGRTLGNMQGGTPTNDSSTQHEPPPKRARLNPTRSNSQKYADQPCPVTREPDEVYQMLPGAEVEAFNLQPFIQQPPRSKSQGMFSEQYQALHATTPRGNQLDQLSEPHLEALNLQPFIQQLPGSRAQDLFGEQHLALHGTAPGGNHFSSHLHPEALDLQPFIQQPPLSGLHGMFSHQCYIPQATTPGGTQFDPEAFNLQPYVRQPLEHESQGIPIQHSFGLYLMTPDEAQLDRTTSAIDQGPFNNLQLDQNPTSYTMQGIHV